MARPGQVLKTGALTLTVRRCDREVLEFVALYPPGSPMPPEHYHPTQTERFEVLSGAMELVVDGQPMTLAEGESLEIPPLCHHRMWNAGEVEARVRWQTFPTQRTAEFYETLAELAGEGKAVAAGKPDLLQMAVLMAEYDAEMRLTKPPRAVQKVLMWVLAPVGWLLGYRSRPARAAASEAVEA